MVFEIGQTTRRRLRNSDLCITRSSVDKQPCQEAIWHYAHGRMVDSGGAITNKRRAANMGGNQYVYGLESVEGKKSKNFWRKRGGSGDCLPVHEGGDGSARSGVWNASELYFLMLVLMEFRVYAFYSCNKPTVRLDFLFLLTWFGSAPTLYSKKKHCFHAIVCKHSFYICISSNKCKKLVRNNQAYSTWKLHIRWICSQVHCYTSASRKSSHAMIGFAVMWRRKSKMI